MKKMISAILLMALVTATARSETFYVATTGSNSNPGTAAKPFRTIGKAATVMASGDRCLIHTGVYRETVKPTANHLFFGPCPGDRVVISGCDSVKGPWRIYSGKIEVAPVARKVLQVFAGGRRMTLARYPNLPPEPDMLSFSHWGKTTTSSPKLGVGKVVFTDMPDEPKNYWMGGYYSGRNGSNPWTAARGNIVASQGNTITLGHLNNQWRHSLHPGCSVGDGYGYIIDQLHALDAPREWYYGGGRLYFYPPRGETLKASDVEVRTRLWGFDLTGRSGIVIKGLVFQAASLLLDHATGCEVSGCTILYPGPWSDLNWPNGEDYGIKEDGSCGVYVSGSGNRIVDCQIAHSWGAGIRLAGENNTIEHSHLEDLCWYGRRMGGVQIIGRANRVLRCVVYRTGQAGIEGGNRTLGFGKVAKDFVVSHNLIADIGYLTSDTAGFYINNQGGPGLLNGVIAYNTIFGIHTKIYGKGIYIDNNSMGVTIHHNLITVAPRGTQAIYLNGGNRFHVYNNTVLGAIVHHRRGSHFKSIDIVMRNNLAAKTIRGATTADHNIDHAEKDQFINTARLDLRLAPHSKAIDAGVVIPGITDNYAGKAPDIGAFEFSDPKADHPPIPSEQQLLRAFSIDLKAETPPRKKHKH